MRKTWSGFLVFLGFWLSPLSPWNDAFTNIPIAYAFGFVFSLISKDLLLPATLVGYWLSNISGFVLMHYGYVGLKEKNGYSFKKHWKRYVLATTLYTLIVGALIWFHILPSAEGAVAFFSHKN